MKNRILIVAPYTSFPNEDGYNRFRYLAELMCREGFNVTLATSSFYHIAKKQRDVEQIKKMDLPYQVRLIQEPGYTKNVCLKRLYSHYIFTMDLKRWLKGQNHNYDLVYCAIPMPNAAIVAGKFAASEHIPFVIDVQDIWPEAMKMAINIPVVSDILFAPMKWQANKAYSLADGIIAVSKTYLDRAVKSNTKAKFREVVYIGTDLALFDEGVEENIDKINKPNSEFWLTYIGTLGHSYDIPTLIRAIKKIHDDGYNNIKLKILGSGPLENKFKALAKDIGAEVDFCGNVPYKMMAAYLVKSDVMLNAIASKAPQSITNKIGDYLAAGRPILNSSENNEFIDIMTIEKCGYNYKPMDFNGLNMCVLRLYNFRNSYAEFCANSRQLAEQCFDRVQIYKKVIKVIRCLDR